MKSLYLNHNEFFEFCKGYGESKTIKFPFNFLRLPPCTPRRFLRIRKFLVLCGAQDERRQAESVCLRAREVYRNEDRATPKRGKVGITTCSARASYQSLRDCFSKKVRAKVTISPQILDSIFQILIYEEGMGFEPM